MSAKLTVLGAAGTVTGSRYLLESDGVRVLVDCGLFQGPKELRARNWSPLPFDAASIDAVVLTHAHIDHSGYLPRLCQLGFDGAIHCTSGTADLLRVLLPDSAHIHEEDARRANRYGYTRHQPAEPLYTVEAARDCLKQVVATAYHKAFEVAPGVSVRFSRAGHILGSACVEVRLGGTSIGFTGDVGRPNDAVMRPAEPLPATEYLVSESTYGDRSHATEDVEAAVERIVTETVERGGVVLVPAFAVGRAQHLMHVVAKLTSEKRLPRLPVFLDSPMAIRATGIFCDHKQDHRLSEHECRAMCEGAQYTRSTADSKAISSVSGPKIIISASGMATGGRVLHHLKRYLPDEKNAVLFVGFQAPGTRGQALVDGVSEVKIHGRQIPVGARVEQVRGLSAHADAAELLAWLKGSAVSPRRVFVTHGEPAAVRAFSARLRETFSWDVVVPEDGSTWPLG